MAASLLQLTQARQPCQKLDLPVSLQGGQTCVCHQPAALAVRVGMPACPCPELWTLGQRTLAPDGNEPVQIPLHVTLTVSIPWLLSTPVGPDRELFVPSLPLEPQQNDRSHSGQCPREPVSQEDPVTCLPLVSCREIPCGPQHGPVLYHPQELRTCCLP